MTPEKIENIKWYLLSVEEILSELKTDFISGLSGLEVESRQKKFGKNLFTKKENFGFLRIVLGQFTSPLILILIFAGFLTLVIRHYQDAVVIFLVVFTNAVIGIIQEGRASRSFQKLLNLQKNTAVVIRGGDKKIIDTQNIVPGDLLLLSAGGFIPADARIIEAKDFSTNESVLTGEWAPVLKDANPIINQRRITDQTNMVFMGTYVATGNARAIAVKTGDGTEMGKIAGGLSLNVYKEERPFQKNIKKLANFISLSILVCVTLLFFFGIFIGENITEMFLLAISVSVAAIPSGLPIAITVILAVALEKILKMGGLVKSLVAAETLGNTTIIMTDKTGTLTEGKMKVVNIITMNKGVDFNNRVIESSLMASDVFLENDFNDIDKFKEDKIKGRPVEKAVYLAALGMGMDKDKILRNRPQLDFLFFKSEDRFSASLNKIDGASSRIYILASPELVLEKSNFCFKDGVVLKMTNEMKMKMRIAFEREASLGARCVATGYKNTTVDSFSKISRDNILDDLVFEGILSLHDPLRQGVSQKIKEIEGAGVRVVMVTGDNSLTAGKIAKEAGISGFDNVVEGDDVDRFNEDELEYVVKTNSVFARVLPEQKLKILEAFRRQGEIVAMTGDGVNDSLALRRSDIGLALGDGTDIAKESADVVLLHNSFDVIVYAIEEGRHIFDNIRKTLTYLLSTAFSEIILISGALVMSFFSEGKISPIAILPIQILWANFVEEGLMTFGFAFEPRESDLLKRSPKLKSAKDVLTPDLLKMIYAISAVTGLSLVLLYFYLSFVGEPIEEIRTVMFIAVSLDSILYSFALRTFKKPFWKTNIFFNKHLNTAVVLSTLILVLALFVPFLSKLLSLSKLTNLDMLALAVLGIINLLIIETVKYFIFIRKEQN